MLLALFFSCFAILTLNLSQVPVLAIAGDFVCAFIIQPQGTEGIFSFLSYVVKVSRYSVFRAVNPVNSWLGDRLTLKLSFPWSKINKDFLNKIQTLQSSLDIYDLRDTLHLEIIVRSCTKNWRGSENALIFSPRALDPRLQILGPKTANWYKVEICQG